MLSLQPLFEIFCQTDDFFVQSDVFHSQLFQLVKQGKCLLLGQLYRRTETCINPCQSFLYIVHNLSLFLVSNSSIFPSAIYGKHWRILSVDQFHHFSMSNC